MIVNETALFSIDNKINVYTDKTKIKDLNITMLSIRIIIQGSTEGSYINLRAL